MNSMERVLATLQGQQIDRRAVSLTLSLYGARLTNCPPSEYYNSPTAYARGQSVVRETIQPDILLGPFSLPLEGEAFGSEIRIFENQAPNLRRPAISSPQEIGRLAMPDMDSHPRLVYFREAIRLMAAEHGREVPIAAIALNPTDLPAMILGMEVWLETLLFDKAGTQRMFDLTIPYFVSRVNALLAEGASFVVLPAVFNNPSIVTREIARDVTIPVLREAFSQVKGPLVIHSGGARLAPFIDLFAGLPKVAAFVLNARESLAEAREKIGPEMTLIGNIEGPTLFKRTAEDIRRECMEVLQDRRDDPHFILGSSGGDIAFDTPIENILAWRRAVEEVAEGRES
jgi:uroporphyrinogen decarboxylase